MVSVKELRELLEGMNDNDEVTFIFHDENYAHRLDSIKDSKKYDGEIRIIIEDYVDAMLRGEA